MALIVQDESKTLTALLQQWEKVAGLSRHKNARSAKESYRVLEGKLGINAGSSSSSPSKIKKHSGRVGTKASGKKAAKNEEDQGDDEDDVGSDNEKAIVKDDEMEEGV